MKVPNIPPKEFSLRFGVIFLAAIAPLICILSNGIEPSVSSYWKTDLQPLFILANFFTAFFFLSIKDWRISGGLLILLTAFSIDLYGSLHDTVAIIFFLYNLWPLYFSKINRWIIFLYLTSLPILILFGMLWAEIIAIEALCLHHGLNLYELYKHSKKHEQKTGQ